MRGKCNLHQGLSLDEGQFSDPPRHNRLIRSVEKEWKVFISQCQVKVHVEITCAKRPGSPRTSCLCRSISLKVRIPPCRTSPAVSPARGSIEQCVSIFPIGIDHPAAGLNALDWMEPPARLQHAWLCHAVNRGVKTLTQLMVTAAVPGRGSLSTASWGAGRRNSLCSLFLTVAWTDLIFSTCVGNCAKNVNVNLCIPSSSLSIII